MKEDNAAIIYFHGFNSNANSAKVEKLRLSFPDVNIYSFDINIDVSIAESDLLENISLIYRASTKCIFIGTSLGGWWAAKMQKDHFKDAIVFLINPAWNPQSQLYSLDSSLPYDILSKYSPMVFCDDYHYFISMFDPVIAPNEYVLKGDHNKITLYRTDSHRFDDPNSWSSFIVYLRKFIRNQIV